MREAGSSTKVEGQQLQDGRERIRRADPVQPDQTLRVGDGREIAVDDGEVVAVSHGGERVQKFRGMQGSEAFEHGMTLGRPRADVRSKRLERVFAVAVPAGRRGRGVAAQCGPGGAERRRPQADCALRRKHVRAKPTARVRVPAKPTSPAVDGSGTGVTETCAPFKLRYVASKLPMGSISVLTS